MTDFFEGRILIGDTETTGLSHELNRITEIALTEIVDGERTGRYFHEYMDPEMELEEGASKVTGETRESIRFKLIQQGKYFGPEIDVENRIDFDGIRVQKFQDIVERMSEFIGDSPIVFHNKAYDEKFLDNELVRCGYDPITKTNKIICSLNLADNHQTTMGKRNNLDRLAKYYNVSLEDRDLHGALVDTEILFGVVKGMFEEKKDLGLGLSMEIQESGTAKIKPIDKRPFKDHSRLRVYQQTPDDLDSHKKLSKKLSSSSGMEIPPF